VTDIHVHDPGRDDEAVLADAWLATPPSRSRLRSVLLGLLAASLVFLGGVLTQKYLGTTPATSATGEPGQLPGGAQLPDGVQLPEGGAFPGAATDAAPADGAGDDAVIGTVVAVRGDTWVVEDLGGQRHRVRVAAATDVVREAEVAVEDVVEGARVDISGATDRGLLRAEDVTVR
jgi:hypothetical protein